MDVLVSCIVYGTLALAFLIWGLLLFFGKGYRSIAGNQFSSDDEIEKQKDTGLGKGIGGAMILIALVLAVLFFVELSK